MTDLEPWYRARAYMVERLRTDLIGSPEETVITDRPLSRYIAGILFPQQAVEETVEDHDVSAPEDASADGDDNDWDPAVSLSRVRFPSSMGLTCAVAVGRSPLLQVRVTAARFTETQAGDADAFTYDRVAFDSGIVDVPSDRATTDAQDLAHGLRLHTVVRRPVDGVVNVTLVIENTQREESRDRDLACWFDSSIEVDLPSGSFVERTQQDFVVADEHEEASYALLYRHASNLAVGHGCAVEWAPTATVNHLVTTFLPSHALALSDATGGNQLEFDMRVLGAGGGRGELRDLISEYVAWIADREAEIPTFEPQLQAAGERHIGAMRRAADRMSNGIALLEADPNVSRAFELMNLAMADQRQRQDHHRSGGRGAPLEESPQRWRPFQIAFILLNVEGLADASSDDRDVADLLWFPTGGGKTEAYLGLIGLAILLRRLRDPAAGGVSALMRYTLRLLTLQQFERASGLVCALEVLRRVHAPSAEPISIGLWIGGSSTPNDIDTARSVLAKLRTDQLVEDQNPRQLLNCPRCGVDLPVTAYVILPSRDRMDILCPGPDCEFTRGLPVNVVDSQVYDVRPSLVIATVDKFAMMPWKREVGALVKAAPGAPAPDLVVQDEFHLISGPLGTLVGLYETALDAAVAGEDGARPKLVASTATVRRASEQMQAVFDRAMHQFPPSGLDADHSFFSSPASSDVKGDRLYVGVMAPGTSPTTLLVRTYASLLQAGNDLDADEAVRDAYWTLLGYFNSLRVLGGAYMQVIDDVPDQIKVIATRQGNVTRDIDVPRELTSRKKSSEIPEELRILQTPYGHADAADVVLATNMISVGVDVDRLGLMAVMGQPQTTAEYIQATSRVGRRRPGLVVTMYNGVRSRDLSHFENFTSYHRTLYRQVEATGATPFAPRARDRGLHGVLVGLVRLTTPAASPDRAAGDIEDWLGDVERCRDLIVERAARVTNGEIQPIEDHLDHLVDTWRDHAANLQKYAGWYGRTDGALLGDTATAYRTGEVTFPPDDPPWPTLTSLRDVDAESSLYLVRPRRSARR
ncbi:helicase-related protein [Ornithinimicrobium cerasi]|uniref:Helicase conserved C-terminal domain-containing protein n=1 Tax=Ornithinimicrobium cerasi TaxID=2248773 RepID=A0A285VE36_9MICO|nr:helicase-related protein [Ornithinimicrobium cerasi]SOC52330.1 Helicase conserved C-terminal domain-containing protein [Ornithinimicrobium cerasi]